MTGNGIEVKRPSPWHGALSCATMTLVAESLWVINERDIKGDTPTTCSSNQWWIQDFPAVGEPTLQGAPTYNLPKFPKNCMKLKEFGPGVSKILLCGSATGNILNLTNLFFLLIGIIRLWCSLKR